MNKDLIKDVDFLHLGENGSIAFARFTESESTDRKMDNDVVFIKSMLNLKKRMNFV